MDSEGGFGLPAPSSKEEHDEVKRRLGRVHVLGQRFNLLQLGEPDLLKRLGLGVTLAGLVGYYVSTSPVVGYLVIILTICGYGALFAAYLAAWVLQHDDGTSEMRQVADPIREGAEGFLSTQYTAIFNISLLVSAGIFASYMFRQDHSHSPLAAVEGVARLGNFTLAFTSVGTFFLGASCSAIAGWVSMSLSAQANIRVTSAARKSYSETFYVCFRAGAFSAMVSLTLCVAGISLVFLLIHVLLVLPGKIDSTDVPLLLVGFGFGSSFVALFMQLGGGIYTKAADVGADMVGKIELGIPEDDARNPAVIADLVGDMVGDCVGSSADVFESISAEIIGTMILGASLAREANVEQPVRYIFFPIFIHAFDIVVSAIGILAARTAKRDDDEGAQPDPMTPMYKGYMTSLILGAIEFTCCCYWFLSANNAPSAWMHFAACGFVGMLTSFVFVACTNYYTDYKYPPVREIAAASTTGHGTNIITGISIGLKATAIPSITASVAVILTYHLGRSSGLGSGRNAGLMGTAVGTMGMLSSAGYVLAANNYGPIADNAGGISEMSQQPERVRHRTDLLDAAGNVTKAITKGYSIGSAAMACFVLFGAFMDEFSQYANTKFEVIDIGTPEVLIGGLLGTAHIFFITGLSVAAVAKTAQEVVKEVRRQFQAHPEILEWKYKPDYFTCVRIVTKAALREMVLPGVLAVMVPVVIGITFRVLGEHTNRPMLGAEVLGSFIMFATVTGILMALFLDTTGGAWDNAKKYIELGHYGGKGSEAHKAAVTGDTVGDPFKDTAGPSLHVIIKLLSTTVLVLAPLFVGVRP
ncbi:V-type H(+)-translocating pyrophosphatase [Batrachochytrium salamandrivorans]|nr:V-type H(+)-translocating pyrophosphatase [Batrachochytrium salamandrivorans]